jgi:tRNA threonylcarbamoyladenosine biosynthesis protein TsaE
VRGLLQALGHDGEVPSPSFALVQPYEDVDPPVWHADLYRVEDDAELVELGLDSLGEGVLIVEWPERAGPGAWPDALRLSLEILDPKRRRLTAEVPAAWEGRWASPMNPPESAGAFLASCGWAGARIEPHCRRCFVPPLFPGDRRRPPGRADGRAAAA